jgi:hypothetical protein
MLKPNLLSQHEARMASGFQIQTRRHLRASSAGILPIPGDDQEVNASTNTRNPSTTAKRYCLPTLLSGTKRELAREAKNASRDNNNIRKVQSISVTEFDLRSRTGISDLKRCLELC